MARIDLLEEDAHGSLEGVPVGRLAGKRMLVTGASGIIGSHILFGLAGCRRQSGFPAAVLAVVHSGVPDHLRPLDEAGLVEFARGDLSDSCFLQTLPESDLIVHAATYGQPGRFLEDPVATLKLNTLATGALLDRLRPGGNFLFVSSSEVYSGLVSPPFREEQIGTTSPTHERACYIEAKRCGEAICNAYRHRGVAAKSARVCLAYGPGTRRGDKRVLYSLIERGLNEGRIRLLDRGLARRTYCYISDTVHMLWQILLEGREPVYNVGGRSSTTIADLAHLLGAIMDVPVELGPDDTAGLQGAPDDVSLDMARYTAEFGPHSFVELQEGLVRTAAWQYSLQDNVSIDRGLQGPWLNNHLSPQATSRKFSGPPWEPTWLSDAPRLVSAMKN